MTVIPVIDITAISLDIECPEQEDFEKLSHVFSSSFSDIGFIYISNHGIKSESIQGAFKASNDYFSLPNEVKEEDRKGPEYQGWVEQGREIFDQDEDGNIAELEVRETYDTKNFSGVGKFPDKTMPSLRPALTKLTSQAKMLTHRLLTSLSLSLGQEESFLSDIHQGMLSQGLFNPVENSTTLRSIMYPPISDRLAEQPGIIRCGEHSDYGTITLLFQDDMGGLEVKNVDGAWIDADPVAGAILVNVGDLLELMSGGRFPATRHRVTIPLSEFKRKAPRQSMAFFVHPDDEVLCTPLCGPHMDAFEPVTARGHLENRFKATYGENGLV